MHGGTSSGHRLRALAAAGCLALAGGLAVGCGGDEDDEADEAAAATLEITASEQDGEAQIQVPESAEAGLTEITLTNEGEQPHSGQLLRVEGDRDRDEVLEALGAAQRGEAFPEWFYAGGGTGTVAPGESSTVTQELEADSTYWVADDEARGEPPLEPIAITGESDGGTLEETDSVVTALDFSFEGEVVAGEPITFRNEGAEPHHMIAVPVLDEEATFEDVEQFFEEEGESEGPPPVDFENGIFTSVLEGGTEQLTDATFEPGRYALACFISNRDGGPPHVELGMLDELEVE